MIAETVKSWLDRVGRGEIVSVREDEEPRLASEQDAIVGALMKARVRFNFTRDASGLLWLCLHPTPAGRR